VKEFTKIVNSHEQTEKKNPGDNLLSQLRPENDRTLCVFMYIFHTHIISVPQTPATARRWYN